MRGRAYVMRVEVGVRRCWATEPPESGVGGDGELGGAGY